MIAKTKPTRRSHVEAGFGGPMRSAIRKAGILAILIAGVALVGVLPIGPAKPPPKAEAIGSCPVALRVHSQYTVAAIADQSQNPFQYDFAPGTTLALTGTETSTQAIADLTNGDADVAITARPLSQIELANKYEWQIAAGAYASTRDTGAVPRIDNSQQVRADDLVNFLRSAQGYNAITAAGYSPLDPAAVQPLPDHDVSLNGLVDLSDLGGVASKWGVTSACPGFVRADANNDTRVSLSDVAKVFQHWNQDGRICTVSTRCCAGTGPNAPCDWTSLFNDLIGSYESGDGNCLQDGDPISVVIRMRAAAQPHLADHGLPYDVLGNLAERDFGDRTYFADDGSCLQNEIEQASNRSYDLYMPFGGCGHPECTQPRWHARVHENSAGDPQNAGLRDYAIPPHHDLVTYNCGQYKPGFDGKHYVPEDGYTSARDRLVNDWLASGHHLVLDYQYWGNIAEQPKCGPDGVTIKPKSDGWIYMLAACGELPGLDC